MKVIGARWTQNRSGAGKRRRKTELGAKEKRRLMQLVCCLALFLTAFIGRGAFPERTAEAGAELLSVIRSSVDFENAFSRLGQALEHKEPLAEAVGDFCVSVFGVGKVEDTGVADGLDSVLQGEFTFLETGPTGRQAICRRLWLEEDVFPAEEAEEPPAPVEDQPEPVEEPETLPPVGTVIETAADTGQALPEGVNLDHLSLGDLQSVTPVMGTVTSGFGFRDHPVDGGVNFHHGIDIAANKGTDILAFADGVVEYVGESNVYGLYMQLDHSNGIKSFYAHCSSLDVHKGDTVAMGQVIGTVGDTGNATGSHLHFQISLDGTVLNPTYYIAPE